MQKVSCLFFAGLAVVFFLPIAQAQKTDQQAIADLAKEILQLNEMRDALTRSIKQYEFKIANSDKTISQSEKIIGLARQQGDSTAEGIALEALRKARETRTDYIERKNALEKDLVRVLKVRQEAEEKYKFINYGDRYDVAFDKRYIKRMLETAKRMGWSEEKLARLNDDLNTLGVDVSPKASAEQIKSIWSSFSARREDPEMIAAAARGQGPGYLGGVAEQNGNDCAIHALATATGLSYVNVAAKAEDLISQADWRDPDERKNPQGVIQSGLTGGEVVMLAESIGQAYVTPPSAFAECLSRGNPVLVNIIPQKGDAGHQVVLTKTFQKDGTTWYQMADSNWPGKRTFIKEAELNAILNENGVAIVSKDKNDSELPRLENRPRTPFPGA